MRVCVLSMFSTSASYLDRYFYQIVTLETALKAQHDSLRLILCEGDSKDDTWDELQRQVTGRGLAGSLMQRHHGNKVFGSVEVAARFAQLSLIWNEMLEQVKRRDDIALIVEGDLIWDAETMVRLISHAETIGGVVAPMVYEQDTDYFHDVWAFRKHGERFRNEPPHHMALAALPSGMMLMDSVGSCLAMPARIARLCETTESEELVGFCGQAREAGYSVWCDPGLRIEHPPTGQTRRRVGTARPVQEVRV